MFGLSIGRLSLKRPLWDYSKIQNLYASLARGKRFQMRRLDVAAKPYLNAGCGPNLRRDFINLDYGWRPGLDLCWDLTKRLPFTDNSLNGVYIEHCLEHVSRSSCLAALREFNRILKPGGTIRVVVPDAELYIDLYIQYRNGEKPIFPYVEEPPSADWTPIDSVNRIFRDHGHQYAYDSITLGLLMRQAGFSDIQKVSYGVGRSDKLLIDSPSRAIESLYMEATA